MSKFWENAPIDIGLGIILTIVGVVVVLPLCEYKDYRVEVLRQQVLIECLKHDTAEHCKTYK